MLYVCMLSICHVFVTTVTYLYISAKNKEMYTKLSGYDPGGLQRTLETSMMILSSKSPVRNPQCPPSTPMKNKGFLTHF